MKQILIVYSKMIVGGSTTSLLSLLENIDYSRYHVDLLLYDDTGDLQHLIPSAVQVLEPAKKSRRALLRWGNPSRQKHL